MKTQKQYKKHRIFNTYSMRRRKSERKCECVCGGTYMLMVTDESVHSGESAVNAYNERKLYLHKYTTRHKRYECLIAQGHDREEAIKGLNEFHSKVYMKALARVRRTEYLIKKYELISQDGITYKCSCNNIYIKKVSIIAHCTTTHLHRLMSARKEYEVVTGKRYTGDMDEEDFLAKFDDPLKGYEST
jgi:hypothetical protein